jgi:hypothetical protein
LLREQGRLAALHLPAVLLLLIQMERCITQSVYAHTLPLCPFLLLYAVCSTAAGESAGGNLMLAGLGLLREQGRLAALHAVLLQLIQKENSMTQSVYATCRYAAKAFLLLYVPLQLATLQVATWCWQG